MMLFHNLTTLLVCFIELCCCVLQYSSRQRHLFVYVVKLKLIALTILWIQSNDTIQISYIILPGDTAFLDFSLFNFSFCFGVAIFAHLATRLLDLTTFPKDQINLNKKTKKNFRK